MPLGSTTLVIPAYNESDRLATGLRRLEHAAATGRFSIDDLVIVFVDDGSTDDTAAVAASLIADWAQGEIVSLTQNTGKGAAVREGVRVAQTPSVAFVDADFAIDPSQLPSLIGALRTAPMAVGSRAVRGHVDYGSSIRTLAGRSFNRLIRLVSNVDYRDTQCGFKAMRTAHAKMLFHFASIQGFAFDVEILARAQQLGWPVNEVPVSWQDIKGSHVRLAKDSVKMVSELARARLSFSTLPLLHGVALPPLALSEGSAAAVLASALAHSPIVEMADGQTVLVAALFSDEEAEHHVSELARSLGTSARLVGIDELSRARWERIVLFAHRSLED
jgi:hypothetical protein